MFDHKHGERDFESTSLTSSEEQLDTSGVTSSEALAGGACCTETSFGVWKDTPVSLSPPEQRLLPVELILSGVCAGVAKEMAILF